jgi:metal-sulfur cluster biosynthetic enzyme
MSPGAAWRQKPASLRRIKEPLPDRAQEEPSTRAAGAAGDDGGIDPDVAACLKGVLDPEIGVNIVDLGLVYLARKAGEHVEVRMTLTSRACPLGAIVVEDVRLRVSECFPEAARVDVELVWDPVWTPDFITDAGRQALGRPPRGN